MRQLILYFVAATAPFVAGVASSFLPVASQKPAAVTAAMPLRTQSLGRCPLTKHRLGVINGRAIEKPAPRYPAMAKTARLSGTVIVQVTVDESGKVVCAAAIAGHPLLMKTCIEAAEKAKFKPVSICGRRVRVSGLLTYSFGGDNS